MFVCPLDANVLYDVNHNPRTNPFTTMGAYTFYGLNESDLELSQLITGSNDSSLCVPDYIPIQFAVFNNGYSIYDFAQDTLALHLHVDGMKGIFDTVVYIVSDTLYTYQTKTFDVINSLDVSYAGNYSITAWISSDNDVIFTNDTLQFLYKTNKIALPYSEDFSTSDMTNLVVEMLAGTEGWEVVSGGNAIIAPAQGTGTLVFDAPLATISSLGIGQIELERTAQPKLDFWYAHDNKDVNQRDELIVRVSWNGGASEKVLYQIMRYDANYTTPGWKQYTVDLSSYVDSACVMVYLDAYSYGGVQHIDYISITSSQNLALDTLLISDYSVCDLEGKEIKVILSNTTNQSVDFSNNATDIVLEIRGDTIIDKTIPLTGILEALTTDTITFLSDFDFKNGKTYNLKACLSYVIDELDRSDDTTQRVVIINPSISIEAFPNTDGQNGINCMRMDADISQTVKVTNTGNLDLEDIVLVLEIHSRNAIQTLYDTLKGVLHAGDSANLEFTKKYTLPKEEFYNIVAKAEVNCGAYSINAIDYLMECADVNDIALVTMITPSGTQEDTIGQNIYPEIKIKNNSPDQAFLDFKVTAIISYGANNLTLDETLSLDPEDSTILLFSTPYSVPNVPSYIITVFVSGIDNYPDNDTLRDTRYTTEAPKKPSITTDTLPSGTVSIAYSYILHASGEAPITWKIVETGNAPYLPDGLDLSESGEISGTPTKEGTFTFTVEASNNDGQDVRDFSIVIHPYVGIDNIANSALPIYPNPTNGKVYLPKESNVKVYTVQGKLLLETFDKEVDLSQYAQGMYFFQVDGIWVKVIRLP